MPIDPTQPPTNKLLLKCGPVGTERIARGIWANGVRVPLYGDWSLRLTKFDSTLRQKRDSAGRREVSLFCEFVLPTGSASRFLVIGHVATIGEVITLYETLSQKKWPTP